MKNIILSFTVLFSILGCANAQKSGKKEKLEPGIYAQIETSKGEILIFLEADKTPMTVANFVGLAEGNYTCKEKVISKPFYDGLKFHRVIADFMIQGGDPLGTGGGDPGYKFYDEIHPDLKHVGPGILSMANSGPATNGSQFFITHKETPWLDGKHTIFGYVLKGQDVVNKIEQNDVMTKVSIIRVGKQFKKKKWNATKIFAEKYAEIEKKDAEKKEKMAKIAAMSNDEYKVFLFNQVKQNFPNAKQTTSGLIYIVENEGTNPKANPGDKLSVHYVGTFMDGTKFDSSRDRGQPMDFQYMVQRMVPGFEEGLAMLGKGGKGKFIIPYFAAYGPAGRGPIPAYADLVFELEIVNIVKGEMPVQEHNEHDGHNH